MIRRISVLPGSALAALLAFTPTVPARAQAPAPIRPPKQPDWVKKSDQNARLMVELMAKLQPEAASEFGVEGDDQNPRPLPRVRRAQLEATREVHAEFRRLAAETDPRVKQDLEILVKAAADMIKGTELSERLEVPYFSLDSSSSVVPRPARRSGLGEPAAGRARPPAQVRRSRARHEADHRARHRYSVSG